MAINKNALIRYKTINKCLQNKFRKWTLNDLLEACSDALYEYENRDITVSKRTIQSDIQMMRSDKLGYNAPIIVYEKKYYKYGEENYSITNIPITDIDMSILAETVEVLKQFKDFSLFSELGGVIQKLEDKVVSQKSNQGAIIHLDKNENLKGLSYLDSLYQSILKKQCLTIKYQSFKARTPSSFTFHPFLLKEFNNRWFVIGKKSNLEPILTLALDRIVSVDIDPDTLYFPKPFNGDDYYKNTIGVTVLNNRHLKEVILKLDPSNAPYVLTKPFHHSQQVLEQYPDGSVIIKIEVHLNFELERLILGFGNSIEVIAPKQLRKKIKNKLTAAVNLYKAD